MGEFGVTQDELATVLGVSQAAVSKYLRGRIPRAETLIDISNHFPNVDVSELLYRDLSLSKRSSLGKSLHLKRRPFVSKLNERLQRMRDKDAESLARAFLAMLDALDGK